MLFDDARCDAHALPLNRASPCRPVLCRCCAGVAAVVPAGCGCEPAYVAQRAELQFQYPTLTPEYLAGVLGRTGLQ